MLEALFRRFQFTVLLSVLTAVPLLADQGGSDTFGHMWTNSEGLVRVSYDWEDAKDGSLLISGSFSETILSPVSIPFDFYFYGQRKTEMYISANGWLSFLDPGSTTDPHPSNRPLDSIFGTDSVLAVYWDEALENSDSEVGGIYSKTVGTAPFRRFIIQWNMINASGENIEFQTILYETTNVIKYQYGNIDAVFNDGGSATIGIRADETDYVEYSHNTAFSITEFYAILWHNKNVTASTASISPNSGQVGQSVEFTYRYDSFTPANRLAKADYFKIATPFGSNPVVTSIEINGGSASIQNSTSTPADRGFATWHIAGDDSLVIQTAPFETIDSLKVTFFQTLPSSPSTGNAYGSSFDAELDSTNALAANDAGWSVDVTGTASTVDYYEFSPSSDQTLSAGDSLSFTITARDESGLAVANSDSVIISTQGSSSAIILPDSRLSFDGGSVINITVTDTVAGDFTVRAVNKDDNSISGTSGLVTFNPAAAANLVVLSSQSAITVGTERLQRVALEDTYGNRLGSGNSITFTRTQGTGTFSNGLDNISDATDNNGVAEANYTASTSTSPGSDIIRASFSSLFVDITLPLQAAPVSYYTFTPAGDSTVTAGDVISYTLTAKDQYGNTVANNGEVTLSAQGSSTAQFSAGPYTFGGTGTLNFTVTDTVAGSFTVVATNTSNSEIKGQSGLVTVNPAAAANLVVLSSQSAITVGTERLQRVALEDTYGNRLGSGNSITFTRTQGTGTFSNGLDNISDATDNNGVAEANYTASTSTSPGSDIIRASFSSLFVDITLPLQAAPVSYYTFTPAGDSTVTAGDVISYTLTAKDQYGNTVANNGEVTLSAQGSSTAQFSAGPYTFGGTGTLNFTVTDTVEGSFTIVARNTVDGNIKGQSGLVTVNAGALDFIMVRTAANNGGTEFGDSTITTDNSVTFYSAGYDQYGNYLNDVSVSWSSTGTLDAVSATGKSFSFTPATAATSGQIVATHGTAGSDASGTIIVNAGGLAELRIQTNTVENGNELADTTITADENLILYSIGYDADGNGLGRISANWSGSGDVQSLSPANPTDSLFFDATSAGSGSIRAEAASNGAIIDRTGSIKINAGVVSSILIRSAPDGGGSEITTRSLTVGQTLDLYANGYDADGNFSDNSIVDWRTSSGITGLGDSTATSATTLSPTSSGSGFVYTTNGSGWENDSTGTISVSTGSLSSLEIRTAANNGGSVLQNTTLTAGATLDLFAAGYDLYGNYIGDQAATWSVDGDTIGFFSTGGATASNTFNARIVNSSRLRIESSGVIDYSGLVKVNAGSASSITAITSTTLSGQAGKTIEDSLGAKVTDDYGNRVPDVAVSWTTPSPTGLLTPDSDITDMQGVARSKWRLKSESVGEDTAYANVSGLTPVEFIATVTPSDADSLTLVSGNGQSGTVGQPLAADFVVQVLDSLNNPVPNVSITFGVTTFPAGAQGYSLSTRSVNTDAAGEASTELTLGSKTGTYTVDAYNSELLNSPVTFTATANPDAAAELQLFAGNQQSGTAGQPLSLPVKVRAVDQFDNPVSGVTINWTPSADGSVDSPGSTTDANGVDSVSWTLRTSAGQDTLVASSTGLADAVFKATVNADAANQVIAVSGQNRTTVAGSNQRIVARVLDQYGNAVSGASVSFSPASRMSNSSALSNSSGEAEAVYTTPSGSDSSIARAIISSPADTAAFKVYGLRYVSQSLSPKVISTGGQETFFVNISNPGVDAVPLDTAQTTFTFTQNSITTTTTLDSPLTVAGAATATLKFKPVTIDAGYGSGSVTPEITLVGNGGYSNMNGTLKTDPGELTINPLRITSIAIIDPPDKNVRRGDTLQTVRMNIVNNSTATINSFSPDLTFSPDYGFAEILNSGPDSLLAGQSGAFSFTVPVPEAASTGTVTIDGTISGVYVPSSQSVVATGAATADQFEIFDSALLTWQSFTPNPVSEGQSVSFNASLRNDGDYDILLNKSTTTLSFGGQTFGLASNQALEAAGAVTQLTFTATALSLGAGDYPGTLILNGTETGNSFTDTLTTSGQGLADLSVQSIANLVTDAITLSDTEVSQGESGQTLDLQLTNSGQASARIQSLSDITINYSSDYTLQLTSGQVFPLVIAGSATEVFSYSVTTASNAPTGSDVFTATINYSDVNSSTTYLEDNPAVSDSWTVLAKSAFDIISVNATEENVAQGGSGYSVSVTIENSGGVDAQVDSVGLDFKRNINSFSTTTTFPFALAAGAQATVPFSVTVDANAATGIDSIRGFAQGTNDRTGAPVSITGPYDDAWTVFEAPSININSVTSTETRVNRGQQNVPVSVSLTNTGQTTLLLDSLELYNLPEGSTEDTRITAIDSLLSGQSKTYKFSSDILSGAPDNIVLGARVYGTSRQTNAAFADSGGAYRDTLEVGDPSTLTIDSVYAAFETFTQGQSDLKVRVDVRNSGLSDIVMDSVALDLNEVDPGAGSTLSWDLLSPLSQVVLTDGQVQTYTFRINSPATPRDSGRVEIDARAYGIDDLTLESISDLSADAQKDTVQLQTPADPVVTAIFNNPATVSEGQDNISVDMTVENRGSATVRVENVAINFFFGASNANSDYTREYNTPPLPFLLGSWQDTTVNFTIGVVDSATYLGEVDLGGRVQGTELNRNVSLSNSNNALSSWTVFGSGNLTVLDVTAPRDSVSTGHTDVPVVVSVNNGGENPVRIDSLKLNISRGSYDSLAIYPGVVISPSETRDFTVFVDVSPTSSSGVATINAAVFGEDQNTLEVISDGDAENTDSWLLQKAVDVTITDNAPVLVSTGQTFATTLTVRNNGEARLLIDTSQTILFLKSDPGTSVKLGPASTRILEGRQTAQLLFEERTAINAGTDSLILDLYGTENSVAYFDSHTAPKTFTSEAQAVMVIDSVVAAADNVSQGETETVRVVVTNAGTAGLVIDSLILDTYGTGESISPALPYTLDGGLQQSFAITVDVNDQTPTGTIILDARGSGRDANSDADVIDDGADATDSWNVFSAPDMSVASVVSVDTVVSLGQSGLSVDVTIQNDGGTPVTVNSVELVPRIGLYTQSWPPFNFTIAGNSDTTITATVNVKDNSATGLDSLFARVSFTNQYSGAASSFTGTTFHSWRIVGTPTLRIVSVQTAPTTVSQGQGPETVQVRISNDGTSAATVESLNLDFASGDANYSTAAATPSLPRDLAAGTEQIFSVPVTVGGSAVTGADTITASAFVTEQLSGSSYTISDSTIFDTWTVQLRPDVVIDSVAVSRDFASTGQQDVQATVYLHNSSGPFRADAQIDDVQLAISRSGSAAEDQFVISRSSVPGLPLLLKAGASNRFVFNLDVNSDALSGEYIVDATADWQDTNDGQASSTASALETDTLNVQQAALLAVDTVWVVPDTISQKQTHGRVHVGIRNQGEAAARITGSSLTFSPALNFSQVYLRPDRPFLVDGGSADTLTYSIVIPSSYQGMANVDASVSGEDVNTLAGLNAVSVSPGSFLIQTPASIAHVETTPTSTEGETNEQFRVRVTNRGQAGVQLNRDSTRLNIVGTSYRIPLDISSPTTLGAAPDTTELIFRDTLLTGIETGEYNLTVDLIGSSNEAAFNAQIDAGVLAYGDSLIVINSIGIVGNDRVLQGTQGVRVNMVVSNTSLAQPIDSAATRLKFFLADNPGIEQFMDNLRRTDTLTVLPEGESTFSFIFDVPETYPIGETQIFGQLSLSGGSVLVESSSFDQLFIESGANIDYLAVSADPDSVVPGQKVAFRLDFFNSGTADLSLTPDSTFIEFPGSSIARAYLDGNFTIAGNDTATLIFKSTTIPSAQPLGARDISWRLYGTTLGGSSTSSSDIIVSAFEVVSGAQIQFAQIDIPEDEVIQGQSPVRVNYTVQNSGASAAIVDGLSYRFNGPSGDVSGQWALVNGSSFPDTIAAGTSALYATDFSVAANAESGVIYPAPLAQFRDIRIPATQKNSSSIVNGDSVRVLRPALLRVDSLIVSDDGLAPNKPRVNLNQAFNLSLTVSNNGSRMAENTWITLRRGTSVVANLQVDSIAAGAAKTIVYNEGGLPATGEFVYTARIDSAFDTNGFAVAKEQPLDNSQTIIVQQPRLLSIASARITAPASALDSSVAVEQTFTVTAIMQSSGESPFGGGSLTLSVPANYVIDGPESKPIEADNLTASWQVRAQSPTSNGPDSLRVGFGVVPQDINTGQPVALGFAERAIAVTAEEQAMASIQSFEKTGPQGARSSISTGQLFTLRAVVSVNATVEEAEATLNLPQGYSVQQAATKPVVNDTVSWTVNAPLSASAPTLYNFTFTLSGTDVNTGALLEQDSPVLELLLQKRAEVTLRSSIREPEGARDGIVSSQQEVILLTRVSNLGIAGYDTTGTLTMNAAGGVVFKSTATAQKIISGFETASYIDTLIMPASAGFASVTSQILGGDLPLDLNSNDTVLVKSDSVGVSLQIVERADLVLRIDRQGIEGNTITRATGQPFTLSATVRNLGQASVDTSRWLLLDTLGTGISLQGSEALRKPFGLTDTVTWALIAPGQPGTEVLGVNADSSPDDVNDGLNAFRSSANARDSINIVFSEVSEIGLTASYPNAVQVEGDTLIVSGGQDSILVRAEILFDPLLDQNKRATLQLPPGYASVDGNLQRSIPEGSQSATVNWYVRASNNASNDPDTLRINIFGESSRNPGLELSKTEQLYIRTVPRATLSLSLRVVEPVGALDDTVSQGQAFRLQGIVRNLEGASGTMGTGRARLSFDNGVFTLIDSTEAGVDANPVRDYAVDQPFSWWIRAESLTRLLQPGSNSKKVADEGRVSRKGSNKPVSGGDSGEAILKSPDKAAKQKFIQKLQSMIAAASGSQLQVVLETAPLDVNSNKPAALANASDRQEVVVQPRATITVESTQAPSTVSTGQTFDFTISAGEISSNLANPRAGLILPADFSTQNDTLILPLNAGSLSATFRINVPQNYSGSGDDTLRAFLLGDDINTNSPSAASALTENVIAVERSPLLLLKSQVVAPRSATAGVLSFGQLLEVKVWAEMAPPTGSIPYAGIAGEGAIALDSALVEAGFRLEQGTSLAQNFSALGEENALTWKLRAPIGTERTFNINFGFDVLPFDANSGLRASFSKEVSIALRVRQKEIVIRMREDLVENTSLVSGQSDLPIVAFDISNDNYDDSLFVDAFQIAFHGSDNQPTSANLFSNELLVRMLSSLRVVNFDAYQESLSKPDGVQIPKELANVQIDQNTANPLDLEFNLVDKLSIDPDTTETLLLLANFLESAPNRSFRTVLRSVNAYDVADSIALALIDEEGQSFETSNSGTSPVLTVISSDREESFGNYPNPFGRDGQEETKFVYVLDEASDVSVRIFTLLGELVWSATLENQARGLQDGKLTWDGRNGSGERVLNGVYICAIEIRPVNGGNVQRYITRIAFIK